MAGNDYHAELEANEMEETEAHTGVKDEELRKAMIGLNTWLKGVLLNVNDKRALAGLGHLVEETKQGLGPFGMYVTAENEGVQITLRLHVSPTGKTATLL